MRDRRQGMINREDTFDGEDGPAPAFNAPPTMREADAALYGALSRVDGKRKSVERTRFGAFKITSLGLEVGEGAQEKDWKEAGEFIFQVESGIQWLIGDWLAYGEHVEWGQTDEIAANLGREPQTLYNYTTVAKAIEFSRRRENVSFSHHSEVMGLSFEEQEYALSYLAENRMNQKDFRKWIKAGMPEDGVIKELPSPIQPVTRTPVLKPLSTEFKRLMEWDPRQAEQYLNQIDAWLAKMRAQLTGSKK